MWPSYYCVPAMHRCHGGGGTDKQAEGDSVHRECYPAQHCQALGSTAWSDKWAVESARCAPP